MKIVYYPDPILRQACEPVAASDDDTGTVARHLIATLQASSTGIGLAANQIGFSNRIFVMAPERSRSSFSPIIIANPTFRAQGELVEKQEGCLSFPGVFERVKRYESIDIECDIIDPTTYALTHVQDTLTGLAAHVYQHETEHLSGMLMIDHLDERLQKRIERRMEKRRIRGY